MVTSIPSFENVAYLPDCTVTFSRGMDTMHALDSAVSAAIKRCGGVRDRMGRAASLQGFISAGSTARELEVEEASTGSGG